VSTTSLRRAGADRLRPRRRSRLGRVPWLLAVPAVICLAALRIIPSAAGGAYAFTDWNGSGATPAWVGLDNFQRIIEDPTTSGALIHTLWLAFLFVVLANAFGLALALSLRRTLKSRSLLRALFFLPFALSQLATAYIWQYIFAYDGPLNSVTSLVGIVPNAWLADPDLALYMVLIVLIWQYVGLTMVIYLAGLESISDEIIDAAAMDGAGPVKTFRFVLLPMLAPAMTIAITLTLIFGLGVFDQILALTGGGPVNATQTIATQVFQQTFVYGNYAQGSALALLFAAIVTLLTITQIVVMRVREERLSK
jgi:raffinose/stachyose/melibiose transport system permease protein